MTGERLELLRLLRDVGPATSRDLLKQASARRMLGPSGSYDRLYGRLVPAYAAGDVARQRLTDAPRQYLWQLTASGLRRLAEAEAELARRDSISSRSARSANQQRPDD